MPLLESWLAMMGSVPGIFDVMLAAPFHGALSRPGKALVPKSILGYEGSS